MFHVILVVKGQPGKGGDNPRNTHNTPWKINMFEPKVMEVDGRFDFHRFSFSNG